MNAPCAARATSTSGIATTTVVGRPAPTSSAWRSAPPAAAAAARVPGQLLDQCPAYAPQRVQGIGLPAAAVQGEDELGAQWLSEGMTYDEVLEVGHHVVVVPQGDLGLHQGLRALQPEFVPTRGRIPGERALDPAERRPSPQGECLHKQL